MGRYNRGNRFSGFEKGSAGWEEGKGALWTGLFVVLIGVIALLRIFISDLDWLFSWQMFLIAIGVFLGLKNNFRGGGWLIMIIIGGYFLIDDWFIQDISLRRFFWPIALIVLGVYLIVRPKRRSRFMHPGFMNQEAEPEPIQTNWSNTEKETNTAFTQGTSNEEVLDIAAVFGSVKRNIYSKNFKGGDIVAVFGGAEVNLTQADFPPPKLVIESVTIFGGCKLLVPSDWIIHNEAVAIFGGIEDKRPQPGGMTRSDKVLVLKGFAMFGGIEIRS